MLFILIKKLKGNKIWVYYLCSVFLHLVICLVISVQWSMKQISKENISVTIIQKAESSQRKHSLDLNPTLEPLKRKQEVTKENSPNRPPLNSPGFGPGTVPMDVLLTGNEYVSRVKELVEPLLRRILDIRVKELKRLKDKVPKCSAELLIQIDSEGHYIKMVQTKVCEKDHRFNEALKEAFESMRGLPPPPSNLLENGIVELIWGLTIR